MTDAGWRLHGANCICGRCRAARRKAERLAAWEPARALVPSDAVAAHLAELGWTVRRVAEEAGLSVGVVSKARQPGRRLEEETARRLLAVGSNARHVEIY
jgi:hypothetical protein